MYATMTGSPPAHNYETTNQPRLFPTNPPHTHVRKPKKKQPRRHIYLPHRHMYLHKFIQTDLPPRPPRSARPRWWRGRGPGLPRGPRGKSARSCAPVVVGVGNVWEGGGCVVCPSRDPRMIPGGAKYKQQRHQYGDARTHLGPLERGEEELGVHGRHDAQVLRVLHVVAARHRLQSCMRWVRMCVWLVFGESSPPAGGLVW